MKRRNKLALLITGLLSLTIVLSGCGFPGLNSSTNNTVRIAVQNTTEQQIVAAIDQKMIEHYTSLNVSLINNLGSASVSFAALRNDNADVSAVRYNGADLTVILGKKASGNSQIDSATVKKIFKDKYHLTYFPTYGFADTYAWMVTKQDAKKYDLNNVSDMQKRAGQMKVGIDQSWMNRRGDGYDAFQKLYGFSFNKVYPMQIGLVYDSLEAGKMDAILGYSTDGRISSYDLKLLNDDKHFFPPYYASPVATDKILREHPELKQVFNRLNGKISLKTMQKLNYQVDNNLQEPDVVASKFLKEHNYFEGGND